MLAVPDNPESVQRAVGGGAAGFVLKDSVRQDLLAAIRALSVGKRFFSHGIAAIAEKSMNQNRNDSWAG